VEELMGGGLEEGMKGREDSYGLRGVREEKIMGGRKGGVMT
jgi:hypothetical protein